jgi:hypothetical protein
MLPPAGLRITRRHQAAVAVVVGLAVLGLVVACTSGGRDASEDTAPELSLPEPEIEEVPVVTLPPGFVQPDTRGVRLSAVVARPRGGVPPLPVYGGQASIGGVVEGPDGPVAGATVKIERWVGERSGSVNVTAGDGGRFSARGLLGGRYRVRAWLEPNLTATQSEVLFLAAEGGSANVTVTLERFEGLRLQASLDVSAINVGDTARLRALLTRSAVGSDGIVSGEPVPATAIQITATPGLTVGGTSPASTGSDGMVTWPVKCEREGSFSVSLTTEGAATSYTLPTCGPRPVTPPSTTPPPDIPPFAIGEEFTVPRSAPLPPGTYVTFLPGCATSYEVYVDGAWQSQRRETRGDITLTTPARDFEPVTGTDGCRFRRTA